MPQSVTGMETPSVSDAFRAAMRRLVATVTIVAAGNEQSRAGMTATAVMSVSADPASLVVGVNREAGVWGSIQGTGRFSVNVLGAQHAPLVHPFSGQMQGEERFTVGQWHTHSSQVPYLADALVSIFCRVDAALDYGTHTLFVGLVEDVYVRQGSHDALLWSDGTFANAVRMDEFFLK